MIRPVVWLLLLIAACTMAPRQQEAESSPPEPQEQQPVQEAPAAPVKPKVAHKPAAPVAEPAKVDLRADSVCPPPTGRETERQKIIRKLDCLLERD